MLMRRKVMSSAAFALMVAAAMTLHALAPSMLGREGGPAAISTAATVAVVSFVFVFVAAISGRWRNGALEVGPWFAWLTLGSLGFLFAEVVVLGDVRGGIVAAVTWSIVLSAVWYRASRTSRRN